jgi:hypothetical protein
MFSLLATCFGVSNRSLMGPSVLLNCGSLKLCHMRLAGGLGTSGAVSLQKKEQ